jgi:hypothetical protein
MALQLSYDAPTGVTHASAYHKITGLSQDRQSDRMMLHVLIYKDAAAKAADKSPVGSASYRVADADYATYYANAVLDTVDQNHIERSYVYLKTLSDYSGASDV